MKVKSQVQKDRLGTALMRKAVASGGPLERGDKQRAVAYLERALQTVGFDPGTRDGKFTAETAKAVRQFQAAWGLPVSGKLDNPTLNKLDHTLSRARKHGSGCPDCNKPGFQGTIGVGQKSGDAFQAEKRLKALGYNTGKVDGVYDQQTAAAVRRFKKANRMSSESGALGRRAFAELGRDVAARNRTRAGEKVLRELGYRTGKIDGFLDEASKRASRAFERKYRGTGENGVIGAHQLKRMRQVLRAKEDPGSGPMVKKGLRGVPVRTLQRRLDSMGFDPGGTDGVFGPKTKSAVRRFQRAFGLEVDGVVGPKTWRMLAVDARGKVRRTGGAGGGGRVNAGQGWGGSQGVANTAKRLAARMGVPVTSQKRSLADTVRVGSSTTSDHYVGNRTAFAVDFGVSGRRGEALARSIARAYGIPMSNLGTFNGSNIRVDGRTYRVQLLWRVPGHFQHVHVGIRRA